MSTLLTYTLVRGMAHFTSTSTCTLHTVSNIEPSILCLHAPNFGAGGVLRWVAHTVLG